MEGTVTVTLCVNRRSLEREDAAWNQQFASLVDTCTTGRRDVSFVVQQCRSLLVAFLRMQP